MPEKKTMSIFLRIW